MVPGLVVLLQRWMLICMVCTCTFGMFVLPPCCLVHVDYRGSELPLGRLLWLVAACVVGGEL